MRRKSSSARQAGGRGLASRRTGRARPVGMSIDLSIHAHDGLRPDHVAVHLAAGPSRSRRSAGRGMVTPADLAEWARRLTRGSRPETLAEWLAALSHPHRWRICIHLLGGEATYRALARLTKLKAGPLYHHIRELRSTGLLAPRRRDLYALTDRGRRLTLAVLAIERLIR